ncbi:hypothetical protein ACOMHN_027923 [Nucella lapillus]
MNLPALLRIVTFFVAMTSLCYGHSVRVIDLTYYLKEGESITWPSNPRFNFTILHRGYISAYDSWLENNQFDLAEHTGTHMDAPVHFTENAWQVHQIPAERLVGEGVVIDVKDKVKSNPEYTASVDDLKAWESLHGLIPDNAILMINTGWGSRYPDWKNIFNTEDLTNLTSFRFPGLAPEAATWLVEKRVVLAVGIDTPSPETINKGQAPVHKTLLKNNVLILENVANLDRLPPKGTTIVLGVMNIYEGSGAPMRLLALVGRCQENGASSGSSQISSHSAGFWFAGAAMSWAFMMARVMTR